MRAAAWLLAGAAALAACTAQQAWAGDPTPMQLRPDRRATPETLLRALRAAGAKVKVEQRLTQPFFPVPATLLEVDGEGVQVYPFADAAAADAQAARVSPDGLRIGTSQPFWVAPPHFYKRSNLLVLYLGEDERLLRMLAAMLGPPFAGA